MLDETNERIDSLALECDPKAVIFSHSINTGSFIYEIPNYEGINIGHIFSTVERNRNDFGIVDYSLSQPSLEQVFISLSRQYR